MQKLSREEWEYLRSRTGPGKPVCWFCLLRPRDPKTNTLCLHQPEWKRWRDAAERGHCDYFEADGERIGVQKNLKFHRAEQMELGF